MSTPIVHSSQAQRIHPKTWIIAGISFIFLDLAPWELGGRIALLTLGIAVLMLAGNRRKLGVFLAVMLPVALTSFLIQLVSYDGARVWGSWQPQPWINFTVTGEGAHYGLLLALQIVGFGLGCALISLTTRPAELRLALTSWKLPPRLTYLLVASLNAPSQLSRYADWALEGALLRGLGRKNMCDRLQLMLGTMATITTLILIEHEERGQTLAQRGIDKRGRRTFLLTAEDSRTQKISRLAMPLVAIVLVASIYGGIL